MKSSATAAVAVGESHQGTAKKRGARPCAGVSAMGRGVSDCGASFPPARPPLRLGRHGAAAARKELRTGPVTARATPTCGPKSRPLYARVAPTGWRSVARASRSAPRPRHPGAPAAAAGRHGPLSASAPSADRAGPATTARNSRPGAARAPRKGKAPARVRPRTCPSAPATAPCRPQSPRPPQPARPPRSTHYPSPPPRATPRRRRAVRRPQRTDRTRTPRRRVRQSTGRRSGDPCARLRHSRHCAQYARSRCARPGSCLRRAKSWSGTGVWSGPRDRGQQLPAGACRARLIEERAGHDAAPRSSK